MMTAMRLPRLAYVMEREAAIGSTPWWGVEREIDTLRASLAGLPAGADGICLTALRLCEESAQGNLVSPIHSLCDCHDDSLSVGEAIAGLEEVLISLVDVENVVELETEEGPCYNFPMEMILGEEDRTLFQQAGADISLIFRPCGSVTDRMSLRVRPILVSGCDLDVFAHSPRSGVSRMVRAAPGPY